MFAPQKPKLKKIFL